MHALRFALPLVSLVFGEVFFDGSASLHDLFLHFLAKCFFCNLFWGFFIEVVTCVGVNVHGGWCWNEKCLRTVHSSQHQHQEGLRLHVHGEEGLLSGSAM